MSSSRICSALFLAVAGVASVPAFAATVTVTTRPVPTTTTVVDTAAGNTDITTTRPVNRPPNRPPTRS